MKELEQEKDFLLQGLEMVERAREWYHQHIHFMQERQRLLGKNKTSTVSLGLVLGIPICLGGSMGCENWAGMFWCTQHWPGSAASACCVCPHCLTEDPRGAGDTGPTLPWQKRGRVAAGKEGMSEPFHAPGVELWGCCLKGIRPGLSPWWISQVKLPNADRPALPHQPGHFAAHLPATGLFLGPAPLGEP